MTRATISGISPFFIVADVPATLAFYRDMLGFEVTFRGPTPEDEFFGIVQRDRAMIMFKALGEIVDGKAAGNCFVAVIDETVVGYGVLNYTFHHTGCIDMLYIHSDYRRRGVATALLRHMELRCRTPKLFTSTNQSNLKMQSLLAKLGYEPSGVIHDLDEGDPEIVYFKETR